ncbi:MAG: RtcB family protein [Thermoprotei archaeon]
MSTPAVQVTPHVWEIPTTYKKGMRVPARIYASQQLMSAMDAGVFEQATNVAMLPGVVKYVCVMPDAHWGYGFPIGGVAAFDAEEGVISPGGIGFDINCGMKLVRTDLTKEEVQPKLRELVDELFRLVPAGVGAQGFVKLDQSQFEDVMTNGLRWALENGFAVREDLERTEEGGVISGADHTKVSKEAYKRGINQLGTLGSGNHYLEVQYTRKPDDEWLAKQLGIFGENQVVIMLHCGSRGFGHQIATDYLQVFDKVMRLHGISVPDRELACAPFKTTEAQDYYSAMACAANMAFTNRQVIVHRIRQAFEKVFKRDWESMGMRVVYDVAHNMAKLEKHRVDGEVRRLIVHRKGATRAFGPSAELPEFFKSTGQPVIIGGSMETGSYLLVGTDTAMAETFGSTAHGSGRTMSRTQAKKRVRGEQLVKEMEKKGIIVRAASYSGVAEEAGMAYKDIFEVVNSVHQTGISKKVVGFVPMGNVKG